MTYHLNTINQIRILLFGGRITIKKVVGIFVCTLMVIAILPVSADMRVNRNYNSTNFGNTLYVGGTGPNNYTTIQSAIDDANFGDTVYVFDEGSPYYEHVVIQKTINLIGEDRDSTIIDGMSEEDKNAVTINASMVKLSGFTIQNSSSFDTYGLRIKGGNENIIMGNVFSSNWYGIMIWPEEENHGNIISSNIIMNSTYSGINIQKSYGNVVTNNILIDGGIYLNSKGNNLVSFNDLTSCGISLWMSSGNEIKFNNLNTFRKHRLKMGIFCSYETTWNGNYWGGPRDYPKILFGTGLLYLFSFYMGRDKIDVHLPFPIIDVDWNPASEPYDIRI